MKVKELNYTARLNLKSKKFMKKSKKVKKRLDAVTKALNENTEALERNCQAWSNHWDAAYCAGIGEYDGAVTILMVYAITYWNYGRKQKSTGAGDTDAHNSTTRRL